jgi:hypothetical protein
MSQQIDCAAPIAVNPSLIGNKPNALPPQRSEFLRLEDVNPGQRLGGGCRNLNPQMNTDKH